MRHGQAHESDRPRSGGGRPAQQGDRERAQCPGTADAGTQPTSGVLAERERVQRMGQAERKDDPDDDERCQCGELGRSPAGQRSDLPEPKLVESTGIQQDDGIRERAQHGAGRRSGEYQLLGPDRAASGRAEQVDEYGDRTGAREREPDVTRRPGYPQVGDCDDDRRGGTQVHAEQTGVSQRVAGQRLCQRPRRAQRRTHQQAENGPRNS